MDPLTLPDTKWEHISKEFKRTAVPGGYIYVYQNGYESTHVEAGLATEKDPKTGKEKIVQTLTDKTRWNRVGPPVPCFVPLQPPVTIRASGPGAPGGT